MTINVFHKVHMSMGVIILTRWPNHSLFIYLILKSHLIIIIRNYSEKCGIISSVSETGTWWKVANLCKGKKKIYNTINHAVKHQFRGNSEIKSCCHHWDSEWLQDSWNHNGLSRTGFSYQGKKWRRNTARGRVFLTQTI